MLHYTSCIIADTLIIRGIDDGISLEKEILDNPEWLEFFLKNEERFIKKIGQIYRKLNKDCRIMHRDVKLTHIFIRSNGEVYLIDFSTRGLDGWLSERIPPDSGYATANKGDMFMLKVEFTVWLSPYFELGKILRKRGEELEELEERLELYKKWLEAGYENEDLSFPPLRGAIDSNLGEAEGSDVESNDGKNIKAKRYPYTNVKFNKEKIDKRYPIVLIVHPDLLFDNPSLALAIQNLKKQLEENIMIVLPYDKPEKAADFCQEINKLTDGLTNLSADDFVVVSAEAKPGKVVKMVKKNLEQKGLNAEGMKLKVIGPRNWAESYQKVSAIKELIMVVCEIGEGEKISRGDIALLAGLVDEGLLSEEDKDRLLKEVVMSKDRKVITVQLEKVEEKAKEAEDIEAFRKMFEGYK